MIASVFTVAIKRESELINISQKRSLGLSLGLVQREEIMVDMSKGGGNGVL